MIAQPPFFRSLPAPLRKQLDRLGVKKASLVTPESTLPKTPDAYLLVLHISRSKHLQVGALGACEVTPGWYLYAGSARGPGGLAARLGRHFRRDKVRRWHIDWLTGEADTLGALIQPGGSECGFIDAVSKDPAASIPFPGFGSSDCTSCASHLLKYDD